LNAAAEAIQDDELGILECLEDYHRILVNTATNVSGTVGGRKRDAARYRAQMVKQLIDRLKALEEEPLPGELS
jgi:hypothetical protein